MFETLCSFPLPSDLFAQAIHPTQPVLSVGLASGQVQTLRLPTLDNEGGGSSDAPDRDSTGSSGSGGGGGRAMIETAWQTRRHKGSCRSLAFSVDGAKLVSAGSDGMVKVAAAETGRVERKIAVPVERGTQTEVSLIHVLSPETLLLATDSSALHIYDFRDPASSKTKDSGRPQRTFHPHDEYISSLSPLPPTDTSTSGFSKQWVTTGGTTLAVTDLRKGVIAKSEDQEDELLSSVYIGGLSKRGSSLGEKVLVGSGSGVLTLWEKGVWDDQDERIILDKGRGGGETLDVLTAVPDGVGSGKQVAVGMGDGRIKIVRLGSNKVVAQCTHDEIEAPVGLGFDAEGRMISGGGQIVKVWGESWATAAAPNGVAKTKRQAVSDSDDSDEYDDESSEEETKKKRKRRKRNKHIDPSKGKSVKHFSGID